MIISIIKQHKIIFEPNSFELIDPELKFNILKNCFLSQEEIEKYIHDTKIDYIDIKYSNKYILRFQIINANNVINSDNEVEVVISPLNPTSAHLLRLVVLKKNNKFLTNPDIKTKLIDLNNILININEFVLEFNNRNPNDYCTICGTTLNLRGLNKISICSNSECKIKSKHVVMDNAITDLYAKDPYLCEILIDILVEGTTHPKEEKIFKPLPIISGINNLSELKNLINNEIENLNIKHITESSNDIELIKKIGSNAYAIIYNAISDNYFSLSTIERFETDVLYAKKLQHTISDNDENVFNSKKVRFIGLNYSYEIESQFKKEYFLFHGTPMHSWYPIIKNGLKVMSGTEFQANGAAYGNGIYMSDQFSMSLGYSSRNFSNYFISNNGSKENVGKSRCIVGVFEISGGIKQFEKTPTIFVINNDKVMLLRYLIVVEDSKIDSRWYQDLSEYFVKYLGTINKSNEKKTSIIKNKRFSAEIKLLNKNEKISKLDIVDETTNWKIEMDEIKGHKLKFSIYFNDYPKSPPKIILESGLSEKNKKIICDNNSNINISEINPSKWEITTNISKIVDIIYNCVSNSI